MKTLVPALSVICLLGALVTSIVLVQTDWSFSLLFKIMLLFISAFIGFISFWKSGFSKWIAAAVIICFGSLLFILFKTDWYNILWNYVLAGHVFLIGYGLYKEVNNASPSLLQRVTSIAIIIGMSLFIVSVVLKVTNKLIYTSLFTASVVMSALIIVHKLAVLLKRK